MRCFAFQQAEEECQGLGYIILTAVGREYNIFSRKRRKKQWRYERLLKKGGRWRGAREMISKGSRRRKGAQKWKDVEPAPSAFTLNTEGHDPKYLCNWCEHFIHPAIPLEVLQLLNWKRRMQGTHCLLLFHLANNSSYLICLSFSPYCSTAARSYQCYHYSKGTERALGTLYHL